MTARRRLAHRHSIRQVLPFFHKDCARRYQASLDKLRFYNLERNPSYIKTTLLLYFLRWFDIGKQLFFPAVFQH